MANNIFIEKITNAKKVSVPKPLIVVIEDVGWWNGRDGSSKNQPYRSGINRNHDLKDYKALALFGKLLGISIIAGFVWCDWDRDNLLRKLPSATWMGKNWDNSMKDSALLDNAAEIINKNKSHIEIAFHGLAHEFWSNGTASRTEFHDQECRMRDRIEIEDHFKTGKEIILKSGIDIGFPKIFIPPALRHSFGDGEKGFQKLLKKQGFEIVITNFEKARKYSSPIYEKFTRESGITIIERGLSPVKWNIINSEPDFSFDWPVLSLHWTNILHDNPEMNFQVVEKWTDFLIKGSRKKGFILLPDLKNSLAQLIYSELAEIKETEKGYKVDLEKAGHVFFDGSDNPKEKTIHVLLKNMGKASVIVKGGKIISVSPHSREGLIYSVIPDKGESQIAFQFN